MADCSTRKMSLAHRQLRSPVAGSLAVGLVICILTPIVMFDDALACGGCFKLPYRSLLEKVERADCVVSAHPVSRSEWRIDSVIAGPKPNSNDTLMVETKKPVEGPHILLWNNALKSWTVECPAAPDRLVFLIGAVESTVKRPKETDAQKAERLRFFLAHLEHADERIADSAHAKLAGSPYNLLRELAPHLDPDQLQQWIAAQRTAFKQRASLYVMLLGFCKDDQTSQVLQTWIDQQWVSKDPGLLAGLLTAYIEQRGEEAVEWIERTYIQDHSRTLGEIIAAVDALRTHGEAQTRVSRDRIKVSFHRLLNDRPPLAEMIIDDFERWQDWSIAPRLMEIHAAGWQPWNTAVIVRFLEACPLPEAKEFLKAESTSETSAGTIDTVKTKP